MEKEKFCQRLDKEEIEFNFACHSIFDHSPLVPNPNIYFFKTHVNILLSSMYKMYV